MWDKSGNLKPPKRRAILLKESDGFNLKHCILPFCWSRIGHLRLGVTLRQHIITLRLYHSQNAGRSCSRSFRPPPPRTPWVCASVCIVWCMVPGVWCMVYGVWCMVCGVWCVVCGVWCMVSHTLYPHFLTHSIHKLSHTLSAHSHKLSKHRAILLKEFSAADAAVRVSPLPASFLYIYIYIYIYTHIYIYTRIHIYLYLYVYIYI